MTPYLSAALRLVVEGDPHGDLPSAIEWLAEDDRRAVRSLLDAQEKRIDRERRDAATHAQAVATARRVCDVPDAARAIMDRWLDHAEPTVESATRAGYTVAEPDEYLGAVAVGIQRQSEICAVRGFPWRCP